MGTIDIVNGISFDIVESHDGFGKMIIKGLNLPGTKYYSVLGGIWASVKRRIYDKYGVMSAGTFQYDGELISCRFYLSVAECEENADEKIASFDNTFSSQMQFFADVIETWLLDNNGYCQYATYVDEADNPTQKRCKDLVDSWLKTSGLETEADRKAKIELERKCKAKRTQQQNN